MMRYKVLLFFLLVLWVAQTAKSQDVALKTNTLMWATTTPNLAYIIHSGFISGYQNRYGDNLKPPTNVYHRMTA